MTSFYLGNVVNLVDWWDPYKAAKTALANTVQTGSIKQAAAKAKEAIEVCVKKQWQSQHHNCIFSLIESSP